MTDPRFYTLPQDREYAVCDWCGLTTDPDGHVALETPGDTQVVTRTDGHGNVVDRAVVPHPARAHVPRGAGEPRPGGGRMSEREECDIRGCINEAFNHGYCEDCLNDIQHAALDLAGVP